MLSLTKYRLSKLVSIRVARFFLVQNTKTGKIYQLPQNIPNGHKKFPMAIKYVDQMVIKYTKIFHSKTFQNLHKLGFLVENKPSGNPGQHLEREGKKRRISLSQPGCPDFRPLGDCFPSAIV
jgi:hypothetical protein